MQKQANQKFPSGYIRPADAARYLNVSLRTVRDWQRQRIIPFSRMGRRCVLFKLTDLDSAIARNRVDCIGGAGSGGGQ